MIVVALTAAVLNEVLERRQRERWSVLAQYALFEFVRTARLVWTGLLELAGLVPDGEVDDGAFAAGSEAVRDTLRLTAAMDEMLASAERREQLHRLIAGLLGHGQEVLGRWANVMVNSARTRRSSIATSSSTVVCTGGAACSTNLSRSRSTWVGRG